MILLIDNYDSFTYNLYQYIGELGEQVKVIRNDEITIEEIEKLNPEAIIISPGPGRPEEAGNIVEIIKQFYRKIPILGICLGHQAIGYAFGAVIAKAGNIMHGKTSKIQHTETTLFQDMPQKLEVMRYHSLVIEKGTLPPFITILAESIDDGEIMALKHNQYPLYGMQFHPESVGTAEGKQLVKNFLAQMRKEVLI